LIAFEIDGTTVGFEICMARKKSFLSWAFGNHCDSNVVDVLSLKSGMFARQRTEVHDGPFHWASRAYGLTQRHHICQCQKI
jgi:hypothetical protein